MLFVFFFVPSALSNLAAQGTSGSPRPAMPNECCPKQVFKPMEFGPTTPRRGGGRGRPAPKTGKGGGGKGGDGDGDDGVGWGRSGLFISTEGVVTGTVRTPSVGTGSVASGNRVAPNSYMNAVYESTCRVPDV